MTTRQKRIGFPSPDLVRAVLKGHSGLGLAFAAILYLVCLTGTIAVFTEEFQRWENPGATPVEEMSPEALQVAYVSALTRTHTTVEHVHIALPNEERPWPLLRVDDENGVRTSWIADAEGGLTEMRQGWTMFLTRLHINLHLPQSWGIFIVGLTGVALLSSLISGLLAHPRIFRDAFHLRLGGSPRLQEADLHNRIGVWALPFHVIVSLTGALLGLSTVIIGAIGLAVFQGDTGKVYALFVAPHPVEDTRTAPPIDVRPSLAAVALRAPEGRLDYIVIEHPTERGAAVSVAVETDERLLSGSDIYAFDRAGRLYYEERSTEKNLGQRILGSLGVLHFGWFGGGLIKIAYGLLGLGLTYLAVGGVNIWLARRRDKGRPAPGWERIWAAVVWGQPVALACAALVALAPVSLSVVITTWAVISLFGIGAAGFVHPTSLKRAGRGITGIALIVIAIVHVLWVRAEDSFVWTIDFVLCAMGLALLATLQRE